MHMYDIDGACEWFSIMTKWTSFSIISLTAFVAISLFLQLDIYSITSSTLLRSIKVFNKQQPKFPVNCSIGNLTASCPSYYPTKTEFLYDKSTTSCPEYFRWIHEDLKPWEKTGITRDMVESGKNISHFRLVIVNGKAYVERFATSFQTRDVFTIWGILQLLRLYPGKLPDLDIMFQCGDKTVVLKKDFEGPNAIPPPPVFHYCGDEDSHDIVFPDWTFWGWVEVSIRSWETTLRSIQEGNKKIKWKDRIPYAFWRGNPTVSQRRKELGKCNATEKEDWNARIYEIDWREERASKFENSKLENQCTFRYKIYAEGATWSVSEKYIIACDSMTMFIEPLYYDFFTRNMLPLRHYWPISFEGMCEEIKYAVDWGNAHPHYAQAIGNGGTKYIVDNLKMNFVYDYMFHLLNSYSKLLKFKPSIPEGAVEVCSESMACSMRRIRRGYVIETLVESPSVTPPCTMPPPYTTKTLNEFLQEKDNLIKQVKTRNVNTKQLD